MTFTTNILLSYVYGELNDSGLARKIEVEREKSFKLHMELTDIEYMYKNNEFLSIKEHENWLNVSKKETWENLQNIISQSKASTPTKEDTEPPTYTKEELKECFKPIHENNDSSKQPAVMRIRSNDTGINNEKKSFKIISPQPEFDCKGQLLIAFDKPLEFRVEVEIINNKKKSVYPRVDDDDIFIATQTQKYILYLTHLNLEPGIYYCILKPKHINYKSVSISFYIQKHLKP